MVLAADFAKGYRMIKSFEIRNFRCFEQIQLKDLRTINLIVGDNASGKTALNEALYLSATGNPNAAVLIRQQRQRTLPQIAMNWSSELFQSLWADLFYNFDPNLNIWAELVDSLHGTINITVSLSEAKDKIKASPELSAIPPLLFKRFRKGKTTTTKLSIDTKTAQPVFDGRIDPLPICYILPSTQQFYWLDMANLYSDLSKNKLELPAINAIRQDFPQLAEVLILLDSTTPVLFAEVTNLKNRIPLTVVSSGITRYLNILLAISRYKNGVVLVDEIENGIYWKKLPNVWKVLRALCRECDVQLFATTHSNECLQALIPAMEEAPNDFCLLRTEVQHGKHVISQFYGDKFLTALEQHAEIR
ncbi:MAG: AAA family ATPase [Syntrophobacteraceae bacterium]|jgi:AAA15 family ATPase/GTPase